MSPEQVIGKKLDARSDLYTLGVIMYEVLTGHLYYDVAKCRTLQDVKDAILNQRPSSLYGKYGIISSNLTNIILMLLAKDIHKRLTDAKELTRALVNVKR